jgi:small membrane protein
MILIVQCIVVFVAIIIALLSLSQRGTHFGKAWKKILLIIMSVVMVIAVLFPETTNTVASFVGVGRGADLLLYITVLAFIVYALNNYLNQQDQRDRVFRLARRIALMEAQSNNKPKKK